MSRFSGKCDFYDTIKIHGIDHILNCNVYVGNSDTPLNLRSIADCVPYYPYIVTTAGMDSVNMSGMIRLTDRSWVDIEEERYGPMKIHKYYRDALADELKKYGADDKSEGEEVYTITPKGICVLAMQRCGLISDMYDPRFEGFWELFVNDMTRHNYIASSEESHED